MVCQEQQEEFSKTSSLRLEASEEWNIWRSEDPQKSNPRRKVNRYVSMSTLSSCIIIFFISIFISITKIYICFHLYLGPTCHTLHLTSITSYYFIHFHSPSSSANIHHPNPPNEHSSDLMVKQGRQWSKFNPSRPWGRATTPTTRAPALAPPPLYKSSLPRPLFITSTPENHSSF
jgi:hypothetical protein